MTAEQARAELDVLLARQGDRPTTPSTFGMTDAEIRAEAARLRDAGWLPWEIAARLERPVA
jgi:hypothetical protein